MNDANLDVVVELEERLQRAMRTSDVLVLDELLADDLLFTNHQGLVVTKQEDLEVHKSGLLKLDSFDVSERSIRQLGHVAIVAVRVQLAGRHANNYFEGTFRYTRVWALLGVRWRIVAAHASAVAA
ncbi:nuclear transport factor 2 family protein [Hydrogenophaga sp. 2FB]|uniref:nuclear transport factor 2 family protein n=1 Tax=Hydrogenophaga sp. 2FB TaxID=2502187 RepID=UPI0010F84231|nr:nuclear transport factor 2 family protein [Hydrogenophaga sp. 2FB]